MHTTTLRGIEELVESLMKSSRDTTRLRRSCDMALGAMNATSHPDSDFHDGWGFVIFLMVRTTDIGIILGGFRRTCICCVAMMNHIT